jgi:ubiquinone/menaquinone biosynthesis C-methylase UbiE
MARIVDPEGREEKILRELADFRNKDVLDMGCGDGRTTRSIALTAGSVLGVDPDDEAIAVARACPTDRVRFEVADAVSVDLPAASFDAVVFSRSL